MSPFAATVPFWRGEKRYPGCTKQKERKKRKKKRRLFVQAERLLLSDTYFVHKHWFKKTVEWPVL
jgi:hypothetical protein